MSDDEGEAGPKSTFFTYMAEGDKLAHKGEHTKAVKSYTTALLLQPDNRDCLVARSKCYVKIGNAESALKDAEASLKHDKEFFKGLYQKAEALYAMGNFEFALVFYHRGHKRRPELQQFRLGIQKAQEAIINSVGSPSSVKLEIQSTNVSPFWYKRDENDTKRQSQKTCKQLLGELYTDKEFLESLLADEDLTKGRTRSGEKLQDVIHDCISYLDTQTEFWRQQKPIYAHQRDRNLLAQQWKRTRHQNPSDPSYILKELEKIDAELTTGNPERTLKKAREVLKTVQGWPKDALPNRSEVLGHLYSCIGNALMDLGDLNTSLDNHLKDLQLAKQFNLTENKSRALDNIGRVYARIGKFQQAIEAWEEKIPLLQDGLEQAWLFHEIGRCYLELKLYSEAKDYGARSLSAANDITDEQWQLNASVLVAQAELKLGDFEASVLHFETALDRAKGLQDDAARDAIQKALQETRQRLAQ